MTKPKKQHYVPQFLLRGFASGPRKNPRIWVLDKRDQATRFHSVRNVAHENHFYEACTDDGTHIELEGLMAQADSNGARIIHGILRDRTLKLSSSDRAILSLFVACQISRTPVIRNDVENLIRRVIHKWGPDVYVGDSKKPVGQFGPQDAKLSSLACIQDVPELAKILLSKVWLLNNAPKSCSFIIGDNPVTRYNMINRWPRGNLGLANNGIEIYMPLSPEFSLHIICPMLADAISRTPELSTAYSEAISQGTPVAIRPENVEFANSLQVIWAERFVFGLDRAHLDLPLDMLRTNPELIDGPGTRPPLDDEPSQEESAPIV